MKTIGYAGKLSQAQIDLLNAFTAGGAGGTGKGGISTGASLLVNGSFETSGAGSPTPQGFSNTDLPGWTKLNSQTFEQVSTGNFGVASSHGSYWLDLDSVAGTGGLSSPVHLVQNGSFEQSGSFTTLPHGLSSTSLPFWSKTNAENFEQVTSTSFGVAASQGSYWLDMDSVPTTGPVPTGANLLTNGSFDTSGPGATATATGGQHHIARWVKMNGEKFEQVA